MTTIDNNNYELWLLRYAEGELNAEERAAVDTWMESHPEAAEELTLYCEAPKLEKDERVRYGGESQRKVAPLWPRMLRCGAAAAVVMVLMTPAMRMGTMERMEGATAVAENRTADTLQPRVEKVETSMPVRPKETATMADAIASAEETEATVATDTSTTTPPTGATCCWPPTMPTRRASTSIHWGASSAVRCPTAASWRSAWWNPFAKE